MIKKIIIFLSITIFLVAAGLAVYDGVKNGFAGITPQRVFNTATELVNPAPQEDEPSVEELQAQLDEQLALLQQAQTDLGAAQSQIETLEGQIAQLQANELVNLEAIAELQNQKQALEADVLSYQNQITTLNNDIAVLQNYITQLEAFVINDLYILGEHFGTFNAVTDAQSQVLETGLDVTFTLIKETNGTYTIDGQWTIREQALPVYSNFTPWYDLGWNTFETVVFQYSHQLFSGQEDVRGSSGAADPIEPFALFVNNQDWTASTVFNQTAFVELKNGMQIYLPYTINITMVEVQGSELLNLSVTSLDPNMQPTMFSYGIQDVQAQEVALDIFVDFTFEGSWEWIGYPQRANYVIYTNILADGQVIDVQQIWVGELHLHDGAPYSPSELLSQLQTVLQDVQAATSWLQVYVNDTEVLIDIAATIDPILNDYLTIQWNGVDGFFQNFGLVNQIIFENFNANLNLNLSYLVDQVVISSSSNTLLSSATLNNTVSFDFRLQFNTATEDIYTSSEYILNGNPAAVFAHSMNFSGDLTLDNIATAFQNIYDTYLSNEYVGGIDVLVNGVVENVNLIVDVSNNFYAFMQDWETHKTPGTYEQPYVVTVNGYSITINLIITII